MTGTKNSSSLFANIIGPAFKKKRLELGLSIYQVSQLLGIDGAHIWRFERGERMLNAEKLTALSDAYGLKIVIEVN